MWEFQVYNWPWLVKEVDQGSWVCPSVSMLLLPQVHLASQKCSAFSKGYWSCVLVQPSLELHPFFDGHLDPIRSIVRMGPSTVVFTLQTFLLKTWILGQLLGWLLGDFPQAWLLSCNSPRCWDCTPFYPNVLFFCNIIYTLYWGGCCKKKDRREP